MVDDATFSPDGKWMWNGAEWIPAPPSHDPVAPDRKLRLFEETKTGFTLWAPFKPPHQFQWIPEESQQFQKDSRESMLREIAAHLGVVFSEKSFFPLTPFSTSKRHGNLIIAIVYRKKKGTFRIHGREQFKWSDLWGIILPSILTILRTRRANRHFKEEEEEARKICFAIEDLYGQ